MLTFILEYKCLFLCLLLRGVKYGLTPLYVASEGGHHQVVELLIRKGANVNLADEVRTSMCIHVCVAFNLL